MLRVRPTLALLLAGPNTGGKTASLKALGLAVLMAKAGMFLPLLPSPGSADPAGPSPAAAGTAVPVGSAAQIGSLDADPKLPQSGGRHDSELLVGIPPYT